GRKTFEPGVARMHQKHAATGLTDPPHEILYEAVTLALVDADAVLHGDGNAYGIGHGLDAIGYQLRLSHEAGAEGAALHAFAGAAAIEIDLVVAPALAQAGAVRKLDRIAAAQLKRDRMLFVVEIQMARDIAVDQRTGGHHLGVQQRVPG